LGIDLHTGYALYPDLCSLAGLRLVYKNAIRLIFGCADIDLAIGIKRDYVLLFVGKVLRSNME